MSPIIAHPGREAHAAHHASLTVAARTIAYATAVATDRAQRSADAAARAAAHERASLLTPIAKAFGTDVGCEVASLGVQVHGGMGFIEETGAAQHMRDVRITAIYEGTNGIQAIDLVTRKLPLSDGGAVRASIRANCGAPPRRSRPRTTRPSALTGARLTDAVDCLERATEWLLRAPQSDAALAGATPYLRLFGQCRRRRIAGRAGARGVAHVG